MALEVPKKDWFEMPHGHERLWIGLALVWCMIMFAMMPYWHMRGRQNSTGEAYKVAPEAFEARVERFITGNTVGELNGAPLVEPPPGGDAYLMARMWSWSPALKLRVGQTYRLHLSSVDLQHGFSLQPLNMNFQVMPGYDHVLTISPTRAGEYTIVCNEFCGIGHHAMIGKIIVE